MSRARDILLGRQKKEAKEFLWSQEYPEELREVYKDIRTGEPVIRDYDQRHRWVTRFTRKQLITENFVYRIPESMPWQEQKGKPGRIEVKKVTIGKDGRQTTAYSYYDDAPLVRHWLKKDEPVFESEYRMVYRWFEGSHEITKEEIDDTFKGTRVITFYRDGEKHSVGPHFAETVIKNGVIKSNSHYLNGKQESPHGTPNLTYRNGRLAQETWYKEDMIHREGAPAMITYDYDSSGQRSIEKKIYFYEDKLHRTDGPAVFIYDGDKTVNELFYLNGLAYAEEEWKTEKEV